MELRKTVSEIWWVLLTAFIALLTGLAELLADKLNNMLWWVCGKLREKHPDVADYWHELIIKEK